MWYLCLRVYNVCCCMLLYILNSASPFHFIPLPLTIHNRSYVFLLISNVASYAKINNAKPLSQPTLFHITFVHFIVHMGMPILQLFKWNLFKTNRPARKRKHTWNICLVSLIALFKVGRWCWCTHKMHSNNITCCTSDDTIQLSAC